jgi:hypothetical protein
VIKLGATAKFRFLAEQGFPGRSYTFQHLVQVTFQSHADKILCKILWQVGELKYFSNTGKNNKTYTLE